MSWLTGATVLLGAAVLGLSWWGLRLRREHEHDRQSLARLQEQWRALSDLTSDVLFEADPQGRCVSLNRAARARTGYGPQDLAAGLQVADLFVAADTARVRAHLGTLRGGTDEDFTARRKDGSTFPARVRSCALAGGPVAARVHLVIADRSEAMQARAELDRRQWRLDAVLTAWNAALLECGPPDDAAQAFAAGDWAGLLGQRSGAAMRLTWAFRVRPPRISTPSRSAPRACSSGTRSTCTQ